MINFLLKVWKYILNIIIWNYFDFCFYIILNVEMVLKIVGKIGGWMIKVDNVLKKLKEVVEED